MRLESRGWLALAAAVAATSCSNSDAPAPVAAALPTTDQEIAAVLYAGTPRTPAGFTDDPAPSSYAQVTTYHVKSSQLAMAAATNHEVCTDDWNFAFAWSEEVAAQSNPYLDLVANETTTRYFEFDRVPRGFPQQYVRQRVLRCSFLDRAGVDSSANDGFAGILNARPVDAAALRNLAEYLWHFTTYNNAGHAVVASEAILPGPAHILTIASLERGGVGAGCDRVTVREWRHSADSATGRVERATRVAREFGVRQEGRTLVAC